MEEGTKWAGVAGLEVVGLVRGLLVGYESEYSDLRFRERGSWKGFLVAVLVKDCEKLLSLLKGVEHAANIGVFSS